MKTSKRPRPNKTRATPSAQRKRNRAATTESAQPPAVLQPPPAPPSTQMPEPQPPVRPPTREELVVRLDEAIERAQHHRIELRLAERAMIEARHAIERLDELASRPLPPVHRR